MDAADRRIARGLFIVTFVAYASFFNGAGWNANANIDLTRAIVEQRTLHIDPFAHNTGDVSTGPDGHTYSNKAPGLSFLGVIAYVPVHLLGIENETIDLWLVTVLVCGTSGVLIPLLLFVYGRRAGVSRAAALTVALVIAFGTYVFSYSTVFFSHVPCAALLLLAFVWLDEHPLLAGIAAGIAGTIFYIAIPAAGVLFLIAQRRWRFLIGGLPFGLLLAAYHNACFGRPWRTPVETSTEFTTEGLIFGVLGGPKLRVVGELLLGIQRGLLPISPVLILAVVGAIVMIRRRTKLRELAALVTMIAIFILGNASFNHWHGGSAIGPRYILPIVPLLGVLMLFAAHILRPLWIVLGALSIAINFLVVAVDVTPGGGFRNPLREYIVPVFLTGVMPAGYPAEAAHVAVNPQTPDERCAGCKYPLDHPRSRWASFNAGELILPQGSMASVVPIALWILLGSIWLFRLERRLPGGRSAGFQPAVPSRPTEDGRQDASGAAG